MCGIAGFCNTSEDYTKNYTKWHHTLYKMRQVLMHRGPDDEGELLAEQIGMAHTRLSIIDLNRGHQPMTKQKFGNSYTIVYNGELYNTEELREQLIRMGYLFKTHTDTEVILTGFMAFGSEFVKELNGIFSFGIWDENSHILYLARDRFGVKPLFYTVIDRTIVFGSEIKALFEYPGMKPRVTSEGLCEIFGLGPAKTYGKGVFKDIYEVLAGNIITFDSGGPIQRPYWSLNSIPHEDNYQETVEKTSYLLNDAVKRQMVSDIPICTLLSGGVDSSLITAICAGVRRETGDRLRTYSFDFMDNAEHFQSNFFQPTQDRPYVDIMVQHVGSNHTYLECSNSDLLNHLYPSVDARDLPNMADVEASLLYFCKKVSAETRVALSGECADEIFGGYPWNFKPELMQQDTFPWSGSIAMRKLLLSQDLLSALDLEGYIRGAYEKTIAETPRLPGETGIDARRREIAYLNLKWFMVTLLDRMDRCSMYSGLESRVPFADHRIVEYVWNVPWDMKYKDGVVKSLLRDAGKGLIPDEILYRKKSPYPKTYHPEYEKLLGTQLMEVLSDPNEPIRPLLDMEKVKLFLASPTDYGKPWYGQLMAAPQLMAYLLQVNYWLKKYKIELL